MKKAFSLSLLSLSVSASVTPGFIKDFNYQVTDISSKKLRKETMFEGMVRDWIELEDSICANRAHLWAYDLTRFYGINTGKIFIFFGSSIWEQDKKGWMYHVAPYIVENGVEYVMEASYGDVLKPLTVKEWAENETYNRINGDECVEITAADTDLTEYFFDRYNLPEKRENGKKSSRCYIRKVPGYYWWPSQMALHDLKKDEKGRPVELNLTGFDKDDVYMACKEAASGKFGGMFGGGKKKCEKHVYSTRLSPIR